MKGQEDWVRGVAARPSDHARSAVDNAHAVVAAHVDIAIVQQEVVGDPSELDERFFVVPCQRFATQVPARHHQRDLCLVQQKVVQRSVWEHHSEIVLLWGDERRDIGFILLPAQKDDRSHRRGKEGLLFL